MTPVAEPIGMPLVSVVIPAYNHGRYLDAAIESVLGQDYPHVELIVLDDGSTDGTRDVLARHGGRFRWETQENMGQAATLNKGWAMARGELLGYLSADDLLLPGAVRLSVQCLQKHPDAAGCYCDFNLIDPDSRVVRRVSTPEFSYADMLVNVTCPPGPGAFFRRTALERAGGWDPALRQMPDYDFWLRMGLQGRLIRVPEVLAAFRVHEASQTFGRTTAARAAEPALIVSRLFERPGLAPEVAALKERAVSNACLVSAQLHLRAGRYQEAGSCVRRAWRLCRRNVASWNALRLAFNALFNRIGHRLYRWIGGLRS